MLTHSNGLWRIEYRSDLTKAAGQVIPVGYVLEAHWSNDVRWLGMLFRKRLIPLELDLIDAETWPEMKELEPFMNQLFEQVWHQKHERAVQPQLGSDLVAKNYSMRSSLQFVGDQPEVTLHDDDPERSFPALYVRLLGFHDKLTPVVNAPVVRLPRKKPAPEAAPLRADVEQVLRAAQP